MATFRIREAADLLGVSDDTVRRWVDAGKLGSTTDDTGRQILQGADLARFAQGLAASDGPDVPQTVIGRSSRNRVPGLVTRVVKDTVMAQVDLQAGPFRMVSLMSREAADELALEPGVLAIATVKATNVSIEIPAR